MRRADRLLQIIQLLRRARRPVTAAAIAAELEVTPRTVYRDVASLMTNGVPIRGEAGIGYVLGEGYDLPPLMFTADELEALILGARFVEVQGDAELAIAAQDAVAKIGAVVPKCLRPVLLDAPLIAPDYHERTEEKINTGALRRAVRDPDALSDHARYPLLFDPQTAGGLLASVPAMHVSACLEELHQLGYAHAVSIGKVAPGLTDAAPIEVIV